MRQGGAAVVVLVIWAGVRAPRACVCVCTRVRGGRCLRDGMPSLGPILSWG